MYKLQNIEVVCFLEKRKDIKQFRLSIISLLTIKYNRMKKCAVFLGNVQERETDSFTQAGVKFKSCDYNLLMLLEWLA